MKKIFLLLLAGSSVFVSCNPKDNNVKDKDKDDDTEKITSKDDDEEKDDITKATISLCTCINNAMDGISSRAKKILIEAGNSDNPEETLKKEVEKIDDNEEKVKISQEFQKFESNEGLKACADKIKKKYNIDDKDKKTQKKMMKVAAGNEDCELVYALMKIGMQQEDKSTKDTE